MGRKPRVDRSPEEKWQIVQEGIKSGNGSETCRRHWIPPNLFYRRAGGPAFDFFLTAIYGRIIQSLEADTESQN